MLENHVKRAQLQSSIWTFALMSDSESIDPLKWGWQKRDGYFEPVWSTLPKVADVCMELKRCKCKKGAQAHALVVRMELVVQSIVCAMDDAIPFDIIF